MKELILLYWGCIFLMYLSQVYYPVECQLNRHGGKSFMWRKADIFMVIVIAWLTCFSFLRTSYNDTYNYISGFYNAETVAEGIATGTFTDWTGNPWFLFYQSAMHEVTNNYNTYFFIPAVLISIATVKLFKRYSLNPTFSLLIFFSIGTYVMYIAAMKQCFAMFFLLLALPYALDRKYVRFYLLVIVAILFHTHAFMFALVPFLMGKPWGKITWAGFAITVFLMATYNVTMRAFMEFAQSIGALVAEEEVFDGHQINVLRVLVYWVPALLALFFQRRLFYNSTRAENLFVNMSVVTAMILTIGLVNGANLYARMAAYFEIAIALALPWIIEKLFTPQSAKMVTAMAGVLYFGYFMYEFGVSKNFGADYSAISLWQYISNLLH